MRKFSNYSDTPPNGWRYTCPETNHTVGPYSGWIQLRENLSAHYHAAGYEMPANIFELVEQQICGNYPAYCGGDIPDSVLAKAMKETRHTFHAAVRCMVALVSQLAGSGERPNLELQEKRGQTCVACPKNQPVQGCSTCNNAQLRNLIQKIAGAKKTSVDDKLQFCEVCHCGLRAKIAMKHSAIWNFMPKGQKEQLPEACWIVVEAKAEGKL